MTSSAPLQEAPLKNQKNNNEQTKMFYSANVC